MMMPSLPRRLAPRALPRLWYSVQVEIVSGRDSSTRGGRWPSRSRRCGCCSAPQCRPHSLSQKACSRGSATQQRTGLRAYSSKAAGGGARSAPYLTPPKVRTQRLGTLAVGNARGKGLRELCFLLIETLCTFARPLIVGKFKDSPQSTSSRTTPIQ